jgi:hypothetical protein
MDPGQKRPREQTQQQIYVNGEIREVNDISGKTQLRQQLCLRAVRVWDERLENEEGPKGKGPMSR